jgi:hypothetical protein
MSSPASCVVQFTYVEKYPEEALVFEIVDSENLEDDQLEEVTSLINEQVRLTTRSNEQVHLTTRSSEQVHLTTRSSEQVRLTTRSSEQVRLTTRSSEQVRLKSTTALSNEQI